MLSIKWLTRRPTNSSGYVKGGEGAPGSGHAYDHTRLPFMLVERASKATRQRGPPPQGSTASHERYVMGGDTPSASRHPSWAQPNQRTAEGVLFSHRSRLRGGRLLHPFPGFLGRVERGWHLETVAPRRGAASPPLAPDQCIL